MAKTVIKKDNDKKSIDEKENNTPTIEVTKNTHTSTEESTEEIFGVGKTIFKTQNKPAPRTLKAAWGGK